MRWCCLLLILAGCGTRQVEYHALSNPNDADAWEKLGNAYRLRFKGNRAEDAYREALRIDPSREHLSKRLSGKESREARDLRREAMRYPNDDELWGDLGDLLRYDGMLMESRQAYLRAFRIDPLDSEWHEALMQVGGGEAVLDIMRQNVIEGDDESMGDLADLLHELGEREEACEFYRRAAEIDPYDSEWIEHASECGFEPPDDYDPYGAYDSGYVDYAEIGYYDTYEGIPGADDIPGLVERLNNDAGLLVRLGQAYLMADDPAKAEETLWGALLVAPTDEEAIQTYLVATRKTRREVLEKLRDTFSDNDEVIGLLADHYLDLGLRDRARDLYSLASSLDEDDPEWKAKKELLDHAR